MRIRRRPPGQPIAYLLPSDPYPAPQSSSPPPASRDHQERAPPPPPGDKQGDGELHYLHPATNDSSAADLGDARSSSSPLRRPALPPQVRSLAATSSSSLFVLDRFQSRVRIPRREKGISQDIIVVSSRLVIWEVKKSCLPFRCTCTHGLWAGRADLANPHVLRLLLSQDGVVEGSRGLLLLLGAQQEQEQQQQGPADGRTRRYVCDEHERTAAA